MKDLISSIGYWWLPEKPYNKVVGKLDFSVESGGLLILYGSLDTNGSDLPLGKLLNPDTENYPLINGLMDGKNLTLFECAPVGGTFNELKLRVNKVISGYLFKKANEIEFDSIEVEFTYLDYWHRGNILHYDFNKSQLQINEIQPILLYENDEFILELKNRSNVQFENMIGDREVSFKQITYLEIIFKKQSWYIDEILDLLYKIENLFVIAMGIPVYPTYVSGYKKELFFEYPDKVKHPIKIDIHSRIGLYQHIENYSIYDIIFSYNEWGHKIRDILNSWFEKEETLRPVYNLFLSLYYNPNMYQQNAFINLCQAVEIYHRRTRSNNFIDVAEFEKNKKAVIDSIPKEYLEWIVPKLSNEPSAKIRLSRILCEYSYLEDYVGDTSLFVKQVMDSRAYYIHNVERKNKVDNIYELYDLVAKLKITLYACILSELTFNQEDIITIIGKSKKLLSYRKRKRLFDNKDE